MPLKLPYVAIFYREIIIKTHAYTPFVLLTRISLFQTKLSDKKDLMRGPIAKCDNP